MMSGVRLAIERTLRLSGGLLLWVIAMSALAAGTTAEMLIQSSPLAGFQYYAGASVWHALHEGDLLTLVREPDNRYDADAIRVDWHGTMLGYVPRRDNVALARLLDKGTAVEARISRLTSSRNPWQRVLFEVYEPLQ